jgi:mannan endo-1,4-beta-mannosidase
VLSSTANIRRLAAAFVVVAAVCTMGAAAAFSGDSTDSSRPRGGDPSSPFVSTSGTRFLLHGQPFRFAGLDFFQGALPRGIASCGPAGNTPSLLADSAAAWQGRVDVLRVWFFQRFVTQGRHRDWRPFDRLVRFATRNHLRLIPVLADQWSYCEPPFKTASWYAWGYRHRALPGELVQYRRFVRQVVHRYRKAPAIMMWELVNEPEISWGVHQPMNDPRAFRILYRFTADMAGLIKRSDPNHLVSLGTRGIYPIRNKAGLSAADYARINGIHTIDACSYHDYSPAQVPLPQKAIDAIDECSRIGKPTYVGEVGIDSAAVVDPMQRALDLQAKGMQQLSHGASGFLVWNWWPAKVYGPYAVTPGDPVLDLLPPLVHGS